MEKKNIIANERNVRDITGVAEYIIPNQGCTKTRALKLKALETPLVNYSNNQLIKLNDVEDVPVIKEYNFYFTCTFFFSDSRLCTPSEGNRIYEGINLLGPYITLDSDTINNQTTYSRVYQNKENANIQAITCNGNAVPTNLFTLKNSSLSLPNITQKYTHDSSYLNDVKERIHFAEGGFKINGELLDPSKYVYYIARDANSLRYDFSNYSFRLLDGASIEYVETNFKIIDHIWIFEDQYLANLLLGNDVNSYE